MSGQFTNTGYLQINSALITTFPSTVLFFMKEPSASVDSPIFYQGTSGNDRNIACRTNLGTSNVSAVHRNSAGASSIANLAYTGSTAWRAVRATYLSTTSVSVAFGSAASSAADTTSTTVDDLSLHNQVFLGSSFNGELAEFAVFNGATVSDANFNAYAAGTLLIENIAGVTFYDPFVTFPASATSRTAPSGQVFTVNGAVSQGASHPITRTAPDTTAPTLSSAIVSNSTPTIVALTMSEAMDTSNVPAASAFTVSGHTVSSVGISGSVISLTCSAAFVNGEAARTVAYTQPGTANARDLAGNLLANFTGQAITNNVAAVDTTAPTFSSAQVANAAPANIVVTMSEALAAFTPAASAFAVSGGKTVSSVSRSGATITLTCSAAYAFGDTITVTYTKPGSSMLQDAAGNQTASFGPSAVTNNVAAVGGSTVTITSPSAGGKRVADGTYRASVACNVTALDKTTHAVLERKTGLTSPSSGPFIFTSTTLTAGTERLFLVKADADDKDIGMFFATPV